MCIELVQRMCISRVVGVMGIYLDPRKFSMGLVKEEQRSVPRCCLMRSHGRGSQGLEAC